MKALLLLAILLIPACTATTDEIARLYADNLNKTVPYIGVLETNCIVIANDIVLTVVIENATTDNVLRAIWGGLATYDSVNTSHDLKVYVNDPDEKSIGSGICYRKWADEFNANRSSEAWAREVKKVSSTIMTLPSTKDKIANFYADKLYEAVPYIGVLETDCVIGASDLILTATIENVTADNILLAIWGGLFTYNDVNTSQDLKIYINNPADRFIGYGRCHREWADEFNANRSDEAWYKETVKVNSTIKYDANDRSLEEQEALDAASAQTATSVSTTGAGSTSSPYTTYESSPTPKSAPEMNLTPNSRGYIDVSSLDSYFFK